MYLNSQKEKIQDIDYIENTIIEPYQDDIPGTGLSSLPENDVSFDS